MDVGEVIARLREVANGRETAQIVFQNTENSSLAPRLSVQAANERDLFREAADALSTKDALLKEALEALGPFAKLIERRTSYNQPYFGSWNSDGERHVVGVAVGDLRLAASVASKIRDGK